MLKLTVAALGLCALSLSAPAVAQDAAANQCKASAASMKDNVRTARELGSRAAVGRRLSDGTTPGATEAGGPVIYDGVPGESKADDAGFRGGVNVGSGDVNTAAARMKCQNNLKQMGTANTDR